MRSHLGKTAGLGGLTGPVLIQSDAAAERQAAAFKRRLDKAVGWHVQAINAPAARLSLGESLLVYNAGWCVERIFTAKRVLEAIARAQMTVTLMEDGEEGCWHLKSLPENFAEGVVEISLSAPFPVSPRYSIVDIGGLATVFVVGGQPVLFPHILCASSEPEAILT